MRIGAAVAVLAGLVVAVPLAGFASSSVAANAVASHTRGATVAAAPFAAGSRASVGWPGSAVVTAVASGQRVTITGPVSWKETIPPAVDNGGGWTSGSEVQTGTFNIALTSDGFPPLGEAWTSTSTYQVTDNVNLTDVDPVSGCTTTLTASATGSGPLPNPSVQSWITPEWDPPLDPWVFFDLGVNLPRMDTQTTTGDPNCDFTETYPDSALISPVCNSIPLFELGGKFKGKNDNGTIPVSCSWIDSDGTTYSSSGTLNVSTTCLAPFQLSSPSWARQFPESRSISDLASPFRRDVTRFIAAMRRAGITERTLDTLRPPQRAYLMHYSWLIAKGKIDPASVPAFKPGPRQAKVNICWVHPTMAASAAAAQQMVRAFGIDPRLKVAPALNSLHTRGLAIDMTTRWTRRRITILDAGGHRVTINTTPHDGANSQLIAVGATYGVIHLQPARKDPNHWSINGH